jgi:hypothetical protein
MRTNVRNALSYAERWPPPGRTKRQWPRNFKKFMGWIFLAISLHYLRVSIENFPYAIRQQGPVLLIRILLMAPVFSMVVSVISGLAWWTVWKGKSSARGWAIAASLACVMAFARQFIIPLQPDWDWQLTWLWIGFVGLMSFSWPNLKELIVAANAAGPEAQSTAATEGKQEPVPIRLPTHQIVPPEPHSTGPDFRRAWYYMPRWLQIILLLAFIVAGILVAVFIKG